MAASQTSHDQPDHGFSTRSWFILAFIGVLILIIGWVLIDLLTAQPAPNPAIRERVVQLTDGVQPDPSAPSRYEELKSALSAFSTAVTATEAEIRSEYEQNNIPVTLTNLIDFSLVLEGPNPADEEHTLAYESTLRAVESLESSGHLERITQLLESPNLANHYGVVPGSDEPYEPMILWLLGEVGHFRQYTAAQVARARLASEAGEHQRAADILLETSRVPAILTRQAFLIEQLVGNACGGVILSEITRLVVQPGIDGAAIDTLHAALTNLRDLGPIDQPLEGERLFSEDIHYATHTASGRYLPSFAEQTLEAYSGVGTPDPDTLARLADITGYYFVRRDTSLRKLNEMYSAVQDALAEPNPALRERQFRDIDDASLDLSPRYELLRYVMPSISRAFTSSFEFRAKLVHTEVLLAMAQHHAETGEWPAAVDELVPDYLDEVPIDPLTNKPIRYRHDPDQPPAIEQIGN